MTGQLPANDEALDLIDRFLRDRGMYITRKDYRGYGALVATTRDTKTPAVMLTAHLDVVPAGDHMFALREADGKLYGRGVLDMKSAIASYMAVADQLQDRLEDYDFGIMITTDEETCAGAGVSSFLADGFTPKAAILLDGGYDWQLEATAKGAWIIHLQVTGKAAHGSRPWLGDSASIKLHELLSEVKSLFPNQDHDTNTLNISAMQAGVVGKATNQLPDSAEAMLDIRTVNADEHDRLRAAIQTLCKKYGAAMRIMAKVPPLVHDIQHPFLAAFIDSVAAHTGVRSTGILSLAASDAGDFLARGIPCAVTYPFGGGHHGGHEWIDREAFLQLRPILLDCLDRTARAAAPARATHIDTVHTVVYNTV